MDPTHQTDDPQAALWNGAGARGWIEMQPLLDRMFKPFEDMLVEAVLASAARHVLDVGCGTGGTTLAIARSLGTNGRCTGIDISGPMIHVARARADEEGTPASFVHASAQTYPFEPASFDMIVSRFGVMFFIDPVRAFANLRRAAKDDAQLRFIAWRSAAENPFMTTAERAAAPILPNLPARQPDAPGQFSFAEPRKVQAFLERSGWAEIGAQPIDVPFALPEHELIRYLTRLGPVGLILQEADGRTRAEVVKTVRAAFDPYVHGAEVRFAAACWMITARARATTKGAAND